jgi:hypothetical protein
VGYAEVEKMASIHGIHLRTGLALDIVIADMKGGLCNAGACHRFLDIDFTTLVDMMTAGYKCGDDKDVVCNFSRACLTSRSQADQRVLCASHLECTIRHR